MTTTQKQKDRENPMFKGKEFSVRNQSAQSVWKELIPSAQHPGHPTIPPGPDALILLAAELPEMSIAYTDAPRTSAVSVWAAPEELIVYMMQDPCEPTDSPTPALQQGRVFTCRSWPTPSHSKDGTGRLTTQFSQEIPAVLHIMPHKARS